MKSKYLHYFKQWGWLMGLLGLVVTFNQCSKPMRFSNIPEEVEVASIEAPEKNFIFEKKLKFYEESLIDIIWVIDNSGSMDEEAAHVRNNFQDFIQYVGSEVNMRVALISDKGSSRTSVQFPFSDSNLFQVDKTVGSTNGPSILLEQLGLDSYRPSSKNAQLSSFLRQDSKKIYIFVTDDNSNLDANSIYAGLQQIPSSGDFIIHSFIGMGGASPCQARTGSVYMELSQATDGNMYNICDTDWTDSFSELADDVVQLSRSVKLPEEVLNSRIKSVFLNNDELFEGDYSIEGKKLILSKSAIGKLTKATLTIYY